MSTNQKSSIHLPVTRADISEHGEQARRGWASCGIGQEIEFDTTGLESYCFSNWEPVIFDSLLLTAAVDFCDRVARRPALGWGRHIEIRLPVHEPDRWSGDVSKRLSETLSFLTGDHWRVSFRPRRSPACVPRQGNFDIPDPSSAVVPFSEGLDSLIVSALTEHHCGTRLVRVRVGSYAKNRVRDSRARQPFASVPYRVKPGGYRFVESSARSRGFKFAMLSGVAAYLTKASEIVMPESGQGALGPVLMPVGHAYEDYRNHPRFAEKMADLLLALLGHQVRFSFPRIWYTKGETLKEYADLAGDRWSDTRSCWQQSRHVSVNGRRRQCGICAACMLRRLSVHAAGLTERPETYVWENLSASTFEEGAAVGFARVTRALREYAIAGTLHLDHLAALLDSPQYSEYVRRGAVPIAPILGLSPQEAETKLRRMLACHTIEWKDFVKSLGADSFVAKWTAREK